jgi:two-component system response regulator PilR (NtrC family)
VALSEKDELRMEPAMRPLATQPLAHVPPQASVPEEEQITLPGDLQGHLDSQEREILIQALRETGFNRTAAAARLGLSLRQMRYRIARLHIETPHGNDANDEPL